MVLSSNFQAENDSILSPELRTLESEERYRYLFTRKEGTHHNKKCPKKEAWCVCACVYAQSCPTFFNLMDCSLPDSVHGISQEYRSGLPFLSPGDQTQGSNPCLLSLLHWQADFFFYHCATWEAQKRSISAPTLGLGVLIDSRKRNWSKNTANDRFKYLQCPAGE